MDTVRIDALVVGAGISGLAAALELRRDGLEVLVAERDDRAGGVVRSERIRGYLVERGPNTTQVKAPMLTFLRSHGLAQLLRRAAPASRLRFLARDGRLLPAPLGPVALARTRLLSPRGKLRLLAEPFVPGEDASRETVAEFVRRRLGNEALERLVGPFLTGVYAGDETRLGAEAVFPTWVEAERRSGSIVRGLLRDALRAGTPRGRPGSWSTPDGLGGLTGALAQSLGPALALRTEVRSCRRDGDEFRVEAEAPHGPLVFRARALILAVRAREAAKLLESLDGEVAREIAAIEYAPLASVSLGVDPEKVRQPIRGFGFVVPSHEGRALLGCLFPSCLFPERAPPGRALLTALLGGTRHPGVLEKSDAELGAAACGELDRFLGLLEAPDLLAVTRWPEAVAQPTRDHPRLVEAVRRRLAFLPRVALGGSYLDGVALADAIASGARASATVRASFAGG